MTADAANISVGLLPTFLEQNREVQRTRRDGTLRELEAEWAFTHHGNRSYHMLDMYTMQEPCACIVS